MGLPLGVIEQGGGEEVDQEGQCFSYQHLEGLRPPYDFNEE